jgi:hypothetical protein
MKSKILFVIVSVLISLNSIAQSLSDGRMVDNFINEINKERSRYGYQPLEVMEGGMNGKVNDTNRKFVNKDIVNQQNDIRKKFVSSQSRKYVNNNMGFVFLSVSSSNNNTDMFIEELRNSCMWDILMNPDNKEIAVSILYDSKNKVFYNTSVLR